MAKMGAMSISSRTGLVGIGAALAAALLAGCDDPKKLDDPRKPPVPKVASQPMVPQLSSNAAAGQNQAGSESVLRQ
jgi:hypothetical protein